METPGHLIVDVARLDPDGETFSGETTTDILELGAAPLCTPAGGIVFEIHVEQVDSVLLARGRVAHQFQCACSRCADVFALEVVVQSFFADFPLDESMVYVDLTPAMREAIILSLPGYPVCREDCKGICARCGANLNREVCTCGPAPDSSWAALDLLVKR